jgi:O-methyltransferase
MMQRILNSRWMWFVKGLPSLSRARALFLVRHYTMTSPIRCRELWNQCSRILHKKVPGSFVECGVWRGGSAAIMGLANRRFGQTRELHLFDSFEGLPEPTQKDGEAAIFYSGGRAAGELKSLNQCKAGLNEVQFFLLEKLQLERSKTHFHVGWFQNTVPLTASNLGSIALLRLDGDWYESTRICLEHLYPLLSIGGIVILDDYFTWEGCKKATDEFRAKQGITVPIERIDAGAAYWMKPQLNSNQ